MALPANHIVTADEFAAATRTNEVNFRTTGPSTPQSITTSAYTAITNASTTFAKLLGGTASDIYVEISVAGFASAIATICDLAIGVTGAPDVQAVPYTISEASAHRAFPVGLAVFTGLGAGSYTVTAKGRRTSGGNLQFSAEDSIYIKVWEKIK